MSMHIKSLSHTQYKIAEKYIKPANNRSLSLNTYSLSSAVSKPISSGLLIYQQK